MGNLLPRTFFSLGNITLNNEVPLFVPLVADLRSNESFLHRKRPDRIGRSSIPGGQTFLKISSSLNILFFNK